MILVHRERVIDVWRDVETLLKRALEHGHGEYDHLDVLRFLLTRDAAFPFDIGMYQLWVSEDRSGCFITQVLHFPRSRGVKVVLLAGDGAIRNWIATGSECLDRFSKDVGASFTEVAGRLGWEKIATQYGYEKVHVTLRKTITNEAHNAVNPGYPDNHGH